MSYLCPWPLSHVSPLPPTSLFIADLGTRCQRPGLPFSIFSPDAVLIFHRQAENSVVYQSYGAWSERLPLSHDPNQSELLSTKKLVMFYCIISSSLYVDKHLSENLIRCQMYHIFVFKNTNFSETADIVSIGVTSYQHKSNK